MRVYRITKTDTYGEKFVTYRRLKPTLGEFKKDPTCSEVMAEVLVTNDSLTTKALIIDMLNGQTNWYTEAKVLFDSAIRKVNTASAAD